MVVIKLLKNLSIKLKNINFKILKYINIKVIIKSMFLTFNAKNIFNYLK